MQQRETYYAPGGGLMPRLEAAVDRRSLSATETTPAFASGWGIVWTLAATASVGLSAYHGYRRNKSVGWAVVWGLLGGLFPIITPSIAFAQGFGKARVSSNRRRRGTSRKRRSRSR